jgi:hypothetical protein
MVPPCSDRVSRAPPYSISSTSPFRIQGYHLLWPAFPNRFPRTISTFGLVPVRSSLLRESRLISFPPGNEIFQFPGFASYTYVFSARYPCGWVSPFGHCRIKACCQLPDTFRRLPRPSSPLTAKASTVCAYSLDHITPSRLRVDQLASLTRLNDTFRQRSSELGRIAQTLLRPILSKINGTTSASCRSNSFVCAVMFIAWWSQPGSNRRPPACKAGALPAELWPRRSARSGQIGGSGRTRTTGLTLIRGAL